MIGVPKLVLLVALASFVQSCQQDGIWHPILFSEQCDDANYDYGDGCTPECTIEPGWYCESDYIDYYLRVTPCYPLCGSGTIHGD